MVSRNGMVWGFQNAMLEVLDEVHEVATASVRVQRVLGMYVALDP